MLSHLQKKCVLPSICWIIFVFFLSLGSISQAQAQKKVIRYAAFQNYTYLYLQDIASFYGMRFFAKDKNVTIATRYSSIKLAVDSKVMTLNGVNVYLSRAVALNKGIYLIGKSDFLNLMEPILRPTTIPRKKIQTILIDPGHGGKDVGAIGAGNVYEKDINLQVALRLADKLKQKGFTVCMTRNKDVEISLDKRTAFASKVKADLMVSLHCNSAATSVSGLEIFISTAKGDIATGDKVVSTKPCSANAYDKVNAYAAYYTLRAILSKTKVEDRGVKKRRFYVIRNITCPSMLVEMGFISNAKERAALRQAERQEQLAEAIAEGIVRTKFAVEP